MAPPEPGRVAVRDDAFHYVGALIEIINSYASRQAAAKTAIESALGLDKIFVGEEGAALRQQILAPAPNIYSAVSDTTNTIEDMRQLGLGADRALQNIRNVDEVVQQLMRPETVQHGNPADYERPQYKPDTKKLDGEGKPMPQELRGPNSIEEEMEEAARIAGKIERERQRDGSV